MRFTMFKNKINTREDGVPVESRRKYSINDDTEDINYPPSTELIPDEYKHESKTGLVFIFYGDGDEDNMKILKKKLMDLEYKVSDENVIPLTTKVDTLAALRSILKQNHADKTCLLIFVMGFLLEQDLILPDEEEDHVENAISIKDVWTNFTGDNCEFMINKPKIFIFQGTKQVDLVQEDSVPLKTPFTPPKEVYKLPAEADMLVVYKNLEMAAHSRQEGFIEQFCNNLDEFGKRDDIIGIISRIIDKDRPLIISTLTRKFYLTSSHIRGHYLDFTANHHKLLNMIKDINDKMQDISDHKNRIKGRNSIRKQKSVSDSPVPSNRAEVTDITETKKKISSTSTRASCRSSKRHSASSRVLTRPPWRF